MPKWQPGQSGNPKGRPPGSISLVSTLKRILREDPARGERLVESLLHRAEDLSDAVGMKAMLEVLSRVDGLPVREHKVTGNLALSKVVQLEGVEGEAPAVDIASEDDDDAEGDEGS